MTDTTITLRRARADEAALLSDLIFRSKAYWGYDAALMDLWRPQLRITAEAITRNAVYVAEDAPTSRVLGVVHLCPLDANEKPNERPNEVLVEDLFVDPAAMGRGVGALLWRCAVAQARMAGARALVLDADPNARGFYERMGAVVVGTRPTLEVPGRTLPRMRYYLPANDAPSR